MNVKNLNSGISLTIKQIYCDYHAMICVKDKDYKLDYSYEKNELPMNCNVNKNADRKKAVACLLKGLINDVKSGDVVELEVANPDAKINKEFAPIQVTLDYYKNLSNQ